MHSIVKGYPYCCLVRFLSASSIGFLSSALRFAPLTCTSISGFFGDMLPLTASCVNAFSAILVVGSDSSLLVGENNML